MTHYRSPSTKLEWSVQVLNDAYIDSKRLWEMMDELFPRGDYKARHKDNRWMIQAPRKLTDASALSEQLIGRLTLLKDEIESIYQESSSV
ncbi:hypothetical protein BU16DRAFT_555370 [Lophium mytilinum]|uniref:Uncharacterized protein n=1 Tax=Lophium mytilinum TaxID=390894 RepID=A0A6A6RIQ0_9PEZI|nr:hypothetical protein BU16DRAFT_555370 [Lophium mytilinum]